MRRLMKFATGALSSAVILSGMAHAQDVVHRADGGKQIARIVSMDDRMLKLEMTPVPGQPPATVTLSRGEVVSVDFAETEEERRWLKLGAASDPAAIARAWKQREVFLGFPNSNAGAFALIQAQQLLQAPGKANEALALFERIEKNDWNESRRDEAGKGKLRAMVAAGRAAEAVEQAKQLAINAEDPATLIEAKYVLAEASFGEFREFLRDNPRWEEDDRAKPERQRLYNETLDLFLYPYLFFGAEEKPASRGIWAAVQFLGVVNESAHAVELARDLTVLYPGSAEAKSAAAFLAAQPKPAPAKTAAP